MERKIVHFGPGFTKEFNASMLKLLNNIRGVEVDVESVTDEQVTITITDPGLVEVLQALSDVDCFWMTDPDLPAWEVE